MIGKFSTLSCILLLLGCSHFLEASDYQSEILTSLTANGEHPPENEVSNLQPNQPPRLVSFGEVIGRSAKEYSGNHMRGLDFINRKKPLTAMSIDDALKSKRRSLTRLCNHCKSFLQADSDKLDGLMAKIFKHGETLVNMGPLSAETLPSSKGAESLAGAEADLPSNGASKEKFFIKQLVKTELKSPRNISSVQSGEVEIDRSQARKRLLDNILEEFIECWNGMNQRLKDALDDSRLDNFEAVYELALRKVEKLRDSQYYLSKREAQTTIQSYGIFRDECITIQRTNSGHF